MVLQPTSWNDGSFVSATNNYGQGSGNPEPLFSRFSDPEFGQGGRPLSDDARVQFGVRTVHRVRHLGKRAVSERLPGCLDEFPHAVRLVVRDSPEQMAGGGIDASEVMGEQDRYPDAGQHGRVIAARADAAGDEGPGPFGVVFLKVLRRLRTGRR